MAHLTKGLFVLILIAISVRYMSNKINLTVEENRKEIYEGAVKMASQVAVLNVIDTRDINSLFDGAERDIMDISVDHKAINECRDALELYLNSRKNALHSGISNVNIPLIGIAGYRAIDGTLYDGTKLMPMSYDGGILTTTSLNGKRIRYTLGSTVYINDTAYTMGDRYITDTNGIQYDMSAYLSQYSANTLNDIKQQIVMNTISQFIGLYCGSEYNMTTENTKQGYDIYIGNTGYSETNQTINTNPSFIEGVSVFAVIDIYTGNNNSLNTPTQFIRSVTFGGAELKSNL